MNTQKPQRPPTDRQGTTASHNGEQSWQQLQHVVSTERISSGIALLDGMLGGKGFFRGSSLLVSGPPGAGKSSIAAHFVDEACKSGERVLYFAFDETQEQIVRDMRSIRIDLHPWLQKKLLKIQAARLSGDSLEDYFGYIA
jgi:circadian clock protein KaiC